MADSVITTPQHRRRERSRQSLVGIDRALAGTKLHQGCVTGQATSPLLAQYRGRVQGLVTDSSQAVVAGATVTLLNIKTGVQATKQTNQAGTYLFDYVDPSVYNLTVELSGFRRFVQQNISVEARGDVTVNAVLDLGSVQESVTISATPPAVSFNSTNVQLTIETKLANDLPRFDRNPFKLSLLSPTAVNSRGEMSPYHSWAANSVELGGGTNLANDLLIDGSPIGLGHKAGYTPPQDAVQEVNVQQNSVDAESGHSAGGSISVTMKAGTNEWHGNLWYLGRNPALNAVTDRTVGTVSTARNNMFGGSVGNPILKNKLFNFTIVEIWKQRVPSTYLRTLPTDRQREGDFSDTRNIDGVVKPIFDPFSTQFNPTTGAVVRTPFAGNRIPSSRFDPISANLLKQLWQPNSPGDNITAVNNFRSILSNKTDYWNFSDRVDYAINEKWRVSGRFSRLHTITGSNDPTPNASPLFIIQNPSARHATSIVGDAVWTISANTVVNMHGDYHSLEWTIAILREITSATPDLRRSGRTTTGTLPSNAPTTCRRTTRASPSGGPRLGWVEHIGISTLRAIRTTPSCRNRAAAITGKPGSITGTAAAFPW